MYIPKHFSVLDKEAISFIEVDAFGQLVSHVDEKSFCTHIPFQLSENKEKLIGHLVIQSWQRLCANDALAPSPVGRRLG